MTLREAYHFEPLTTKGLENKNKFYEAYEEIEPILTGCYINRNKTVSLDNPYYARSSYLQKEFNKETQNLNLQTGTLQN